MVLENFYENLSIFHLGTEPNRSYYIPCSNKKSFGTLDMKEVSDKITMLNGKWKFAFFDSLDFVPSDIVGEMFWEKKSEKINVPSVWQYEGYDKHQYINLEYPIPYDPPYVPNDNPCGVYFRNFDVTEQQLNEKCYLNLEGVDSCFYLWINGKFVGYSQVSHCTSEFEISEFIKKGCNSLTVLVLKWCDGTYFEDQDKFRTTGIFRDVYLIFRPKEHLRDYKIVTHLMNDYKKVTVDIELAKKGDFKVKFIFEDKNGNVLQKGETNGGNICFSIDNPLLWNAETPNLYLLTLIANGEYIQEYIGFREIYVKDGVVYLNGQNIKFRGVNRHDSHPEKGPAVDKSDILKDMKIMKEHNINAIRTSHYPNAPILPIYADYYGFYLVAEADFEAHGVLGLYGDGMDYTKISNDSIFEKAIMDRQDLNYHRDKNRSSVVFWSLGNESFWGCNLEKAAEYVKNLDNTRLLQYESCRVKEGMTEDYSKLDVLSKMYATYDFIDNYCIEQEKLKSENRKPLILCEYCHAMGNGPGDLEDYFELFDKYDYACGGFVWEWCDHAIMAGVAENGKKKYLYGGDSGELSHDGNYCMDGLVYPDRAVSNSLREFKNVNRPVRIRYENGKIFITNHMDFLSILESIEIFWEITEDGEIIAGGKLENLPEILPHQTAEVSFEISSPIGNSTFIMFYAKNIRSYPEITVDKEKNPLICIGHFLGFDQQRLTKDIKYILPKRSGSVGVTIEQNKLILFGKNFLYNFDKIHGVFSQLKYDGKNIMLNPLSYNIWRAPTDNDKEVSKLWKKVHFDRAKLKVYNIELLNSENSTTIKTTASLGADGIQKFMDIITSWQVDGVGNIIFECKVKKNPTIPMLPRFGIRMFLPKEYENVVYFGKGPYESYIDKQHSSWYGKFETTVTDLHEDYIKPQENGSHIGTEYFTISNVSEERELTVSATTQPFSFNLSHYSQETLEKTAHNFELIPDDATVVCIDYAHNGIGSRSCGPILKKNYRLDKEEFEFGFLLSFCKIK